MNEIYLGDCRDILKDIRDVDLVVTSPPYDNLRTYEGSLEWNFEIFKEVANLLKDSLKDGGVIVWIVGDSTVDGSETGSSFKQALYFKEIGLNLHDTMIWNKGSFTFPSKLTYHNVFEYMFILSKGTPKTLNFIKDRKNLYLGRRGASGRNKDGERNRGYSEVTEEYGKRFNIWDCSIGGGHTTKDKINHPAMFPESLVRDHILTWSNKGDLVLDCFSGSGTTCKVAYELERRYIGIEKVKEYYDDSIERLKRVKMKKRLF